MHTVCVTTRGGVAQTGEAETAEDLIPSGNTERLTASQVNICKTVLVTTGRATGEARQKALSLRICGTCTSSVG